MAAVDVLFQNAASKGSEGRVPCLNIIGVDIESVISSFSLSLFPLLGSGEECSFSIHSHQDLNVFTIMTLFNLTTWRVIIPTF